LDRIDPANVFETEERLVGIPPWWRAFIFQILNGRQLSVYLYLLTLMDADGVCSPTTRQIAEDLGLLSSTMVFDSINVLEDYGLLLRSRKRAPVSGSRRNVYQRPSSEYTIWRLLKQDRIDERLRARRGLRFAANAVSLFEEGLRVLLARRYERYARAKSGEKRAALVALLEEILFEKQQLLREDLRASSA